MKNIETTNTEYMKTLNLQLLFFISCLTFFCCCSDKTERTTELTVKNDIDIKPITTTNGGNNTELFKEGYNCTSLASSLNANIYVNDNGTEAITLILNDQNDPAYYLRFVINEEYSDNSISFTAFNELDAPIMSGIYSEKANYIKLTKIYGNDVITRASAAAWGCNLSIWASGAIWSLAASSVSAGAGLVIGLAYTAAAVQICDEL